MLSLKFEDVRAFGLRIRTQIRVPGASLVQRTEQPPDLYILLDQQPRLKVPDVSGRYALSNDLLWINVPEVACFSYCQLNSTLVVQVSSEAALDLVEAILISTALPAVLWMNQHIVLHAAVAVLPGMREAVAFAGPSGSGKSVLIHRLLAARAHIVAEDTCILDPKTLLVAGLPGMIMMRTNPADAPDLRAEVPVPSDRQLALAKLGLLCTLGTPEEPATQLYGPTALEALLNNLHRPRLPHLLARMPTVLPQLASLLQRLPVYSIHRAMTVESLSNLLEVMK